MCERTIEMGGEIDLQNEARSVSCTFVECGASCNALHSVNISQSVFE